MCLTFMKSVNRWTDAPSAEEIMEAARQLYTFFKWCRVGWSLKNHGQSNYP